MKYYRVNIEDYKIGISCGNNMPTKEFLNNQVHEFLKSQKVNINRNETFKFQDSNEKEFEDLKREVALSSNFKMRY
ncbi:hypothetical protein [Bacteroides uniformis]|jgi:galactitol-specific phosphotransferase system IIB component|uniref:Uncharacterized protein n=1 Tax=Bacteroides uniformis TaxID=820 RepID=A0A7J5GJM7_BACUN|nr:hypothetical protein [Bacteroides uniformis]KAB4092416.1 hypothetical protein GAQ56_09215 [Bacteroides uniformis]KAB4098772.1 hypothetical protein GAQ45_00605 [Bacteroides uniformis]KAB4103635.1 hypothetical protein GAQ57_09180 [Bacteroides uniformis]KAB4107565.1 hypothetical protein GAQ49_00595 [Bacteroides uniformis]